MSSGLGSHITSCSKYEETEASKIFMGKNMVACREILFVCEKTGICEIQVSFAAWLSGTRCVFTKKKRCQIQDDFLENWEVPATNSDGEASICSVWHVTVFWKDVGAFSHVHCVTGFVGVIKGDYMWIADNRAGPWITKTKKRE